MPPTRGLWRSCSWRRAPWTADARATARQARGRRRSQPACSMSPTALIDSPVGALLLGGNRTGTGPGRLRDRGPRCRPATTSRRGQPAHPARAGPTGCCRSRTRRVLRGHATQLRPDAGPQPVHGGSAAPCLTQLPAIGYGQTRSYAEVAVAAGSPAGGARGGLGLRHQPAAAGRAVPSGRALRRHRRRLRRRSGGQAHPALPGGGLGRSRTVESGRMASAPPAELATCPDSDCGGRTWREHRCRTSRSARTGWPARPGPRPTRCCASTTTPSGGCRSATNAASTNGSASRRSRPDCPGRPSCASVPRSGPRSTISIRMRSPPSRRPTSSDSCPIPGSSATG